jgi:uncharacterized protein (TIGR03792 family)
MVQAMVQAMVVEWLTVHVPLVHQRSFIETDAAIWTPALARNAGFIGKQVWRAQDDPETLNLVITWQSRAQWHAVSRALLDETDQRFQQAMSEQAFGGTFPVLRCIDYDILTGND